MMSCDLRVVQFFVDFFTSQSVHKNQLVVEEELLLEADEQGNSLISNAVATGKVDIVEWMLKRCPKVVEKQSTTKNGIQTGGLYGVAALHGHM